MSRSHLVRYGVLSTLSLTLLLLLAACGSSGSNSVATPLVPAGAVQNACSTANGSLNPDPSKDLAFVAQDAKGNAMANRSIIIGFYKNDGTYMGSVSGTTDKNGVFYVDTSTTAYRWLAGVPASAFVAVDGDATTPGLATACGNVDGAGTFTVSTGDPGLADVTFSLHNGSSTTTVPYIFPAFVFHGEAREANALYAGATKQVMMLDGSYDLGMFTVSNGATYILYQPTTISGTTTVSTDVGTASTAQLHYTVTGATGSQVMTAQSVAIFREASNLDMRWGPITNLQDVYVSVGTYKARGSGSLTDSAGLKWDYDFTNFSTPNSFDLTTAGGSLSHTFGGALTATLATDQASYAKGATVTLTPHAADPAGDLLTDVFEETSPSNGTYAHVNVTVKDPNGNIVYTNNLISMYATSFNLSSAAPTGTYTASLTWDIGPYQSAPLTASTTFQVN